MKIYLLGFILLFFSLRGYSQPYIFNNPNKTNSEKTVLSNSNRSANSRVIIPLQFKKSNLTATVFGFLPSGQYQSERNYLRYDLLTHIACANFPADSLGNVSEPEYWPWTDVINKAHENGVKIILCTTNFVASQMHYFLNSGSARQNLLVNLKDMLQEYKLDGVNVDFERFYTADAGDLLNGFMSDLTEYLHKEIPGCEVSFAGPHYNWGGAWRFSGLADACDYIFLMGYAYSGVSSLYTGSNAPLLGGSKNITGMLTQQYGGVLENNPQKLILGVPYYGNKWFTETKEPHARIIKFLWSQPYYKNIKEAQVTGMHWDTTESSPWYCWRINDTTWCQVWFDNDSSLTLKYELAKRYNLKGVGMWALGYDGSRPELWNAIEKQFLITNVRNDESSVLSFRLAQNYPNPFNPVTTISYYINRRRFCIVENLRYAGKRDGSAC